MTLYYTPIQSNLTLQFKKLFLLFRQLIDYLNNGSVMVQIVGKQVHFQSD